MVDSTALLVDEILPHQPIRQWVLTVPFPLCFLFASQPAVMGKVLGIVYRAIATHLTRNGQVRYELKTPWRNGTTHVIFEPLDFISRHLRSASQP